MDFSKPYKTISMPQYETTLKKYVDEKVVMTDDIKKFFKQLKAINNEEQLFDFVKQNTEQIGDDLYRKDNFIIVPTHGAGSDVTELTIGHINSLGINSVPKLIYNFDNTSFFKMFVYDIGTNEKLVPFNSMNATDRAKTEFYEDIKKMADNKCVDEKDVLDTTKWFQNVEGTRIFILNPNIGGYLENGKIEPLKKQVFDILFN